MSVCARHAAVSAVVLMTIVAIFSGNATAYGVIGLNASSIVDDVRQLQDVRNQSSQVKRNYIRGERKAAVITQRLPDMKMEVCNAERLQQTIKVRGCEPRTVVNRYCYGQCNSFFIPRSATPRPRGPGGRRRSRHQPPPSLSGVPAVAASPTGGGGRPGRGRALTWAAFRSCSYCRPKRVEWITVGLNCPRRRPSYRRRRVEIVKECACAALTLD